PVACPTAARRRIGRDDRRDRLPHVRLTDGDPGASPARDISVLPDEYQRCDVAQHGGVLSPRVATSAAGAAVASDRDGCGGGTVLWPLLQYAAAPRDRARP